MTYHPDDTAILARLIAHLTDHIDQAFRACGYDVDFALAVVTDGKIIRTGVVHGHAANHMPAVIEIFKEAAAHPVESSSQVRVTLDPAGTIVPKECLQ